MTAHPDAPGLPRFPLGDFLGLELSGPEPGTCKATISVQEVCLNPHDNVHGGVLFTMVDTAMGGAAMSVLPAGQRCASIELSMRYLRPVTSGTLTATAHVLRQGRAVIHLDATIMCDHTLVATSQGTFAVTDSPGNRQAGSDERPR